MENDKIKEKKIDILALFKSFINPAVEEEAREEVILKDTKLSESKKKELLKTLNKCDIIMEKISSSYTANLKVDTKKLKKENIIISESEKENEVKEKTYFEDNEKEQEK